MMSAKRFGLGLLVAVAFAVAGGRAEAGFVIASGDSNITSALTAGNGPPVDPGNQRFFRNVLGSGTRVLIAANSIGFATTPANNFYNSLSGVTSSIDTNLVTAADLVGVNVFLSIARSNAYSNAEIAALSAFSAAGGTILVTAEFGAFTTEIVVANGLLAGLGTGQVIVPGQFGTGSFETASGSQIAANPLNTGVTSFTFAATSQVTGGTTLFTTQGPNGVAFVTVANLGPAAVATPAPASLAVLGLALPAMLAAFRRRRAG